MPVLIGEIYQGWNQVYYHDHGVASDESATDF